MEFGTVVLWIAGIALPVLVGWGISLLGKHLRDKNIAELIAQKPIISDMIVRAMKDMYEDGEGELKLKGGIEAFIDWLNSVGLPAKYEDAEVFIRGSYQRMKDELVTSGIIVVEEFEDEEKEL